MAEVRAVSHPEREGDPLSARAFRMDNAVAVQVLLKGPLRLVRIDGEEDEVPGERRLTVIDSEGTCLEIFGPTDEIERLTEERADFSTPPPPRWWHPSRIPDEVAHFYGLPPELRGY